MRPSAAITVVLAVLALAAGCGGEERPIRLGVLSDCGGYFAGSHELSLAAAQLPLIERGARPAGKHPSDGLRDARIAGRPVEIAVRCGDTNDLRLTVDEGRALVDRDGADIVVGPTYGPGAGLALREVARRYRDVAFLVTGSAAQELTLRDPAPNLFRFAADQAQLTAGLGSYAYRDLGWRTAALVATSWQLSWPQAAGFVAEFCALGGRVLDRRWQLLGTPLAPTAARVPAGVDGVVLITDGFVDDPLTFAKAYANVQPDLVRHLVLGPHAFKPFGDARVFSKEARALNGVVASIEAPYESSGAAWLRFRREYEQSFPELKAPASPADFLIQLAYYDAVRALVIALEHVDGDLSTGERRLMAALAKVELDTPTGPIRLDRHRQAIADAYLGRIETAAGGKPTMRTLRVLPAVEQTFGGYFTGATPPPTETTPACRRSTPPPWAS